MWKRPAPKRQKSCRTVPKMVQNPQKQRPSITKSPENLPDASIPLKTTVLRGILSFVIVVPKLSQLELS